MATADRRHWPGLAKKSCGAGGKAGDSFVELQGDQRERLHEILAKKGWTVKG